MQILRVSVEADRRKSRSGTLATNISTPSRGSHSRHCAASRVFNCAARTRKVQNPAKLCAIGEATRKSVSVSAWQTRRAQWFAWAVDSGARQKLVVNALDLRANMPPVEVGQDRGSRVGSQLGCELSIIQESDNSAAQGLTIVIQEQ